MDAQADGSTERFRAWRDALPAPSPAATCRTRRRWTPGLGARLRAHRPVPDRHQDAWLVLGLGAGHEGVLADAVHAGPGDRARVRRAWPRPCSACCTRPTRSTAAATTSSSPRAGCGRRRRARGGRPGRPRGVLRRGAPTSRTWTCSRPRTGSRSRTRTGAPVARRELKDLPLGEGPAWRSAEERARSRPTSAPRLLPAWSARSEHDLAAPELGFGAGRRAPRAGRPGPREQAAMAKYSRTGFEAAAVTGFAAFAAHARRSFPPGRRAALRSLRTRSSRWPRPRPTMSAGGPGVVPGSAAPTARRARPVRPARLSAWVSEPRRPTTDTAAARRSWLDRRSFLPG